MKMMSFNQVQTVKRQNTATKTGLTHKKNQKASSFKEH